ncbi:RICIN domain-containing protein [Isoptericola croceus]|uniref:RICIN domain-containing protein n=1 Tax=Isoptericola croceus TaxID=3031406 RepID=UPI0023F66AFA|nr:RICIN domain-containing protein [Isoptericola croceus]
MTIVHQGALEMAELAGEKSQDPAVQELAAGIAGAQQPGTQVVIWDCSGHANQQWNVNADGTITGVHSGLCLDAAGWGTSNGTTVQLWTCGGGQANQQWTRR